MSTAAPSSAARRLVHHPRVVGLLVLVVALLVFANVSQVDGDAATAFRSTSIVDDAALDTTLAARRGEVIGYGLVEYGALVLAGVGAAVAIVGPSVAGRRKQQP